MIGRVILGINNIFTVECHEERYECRIKGKILKDVVGAYNPLAVGDLVNFELDEHHPGKGMILSRKERKNFFARWNKKRRAPQTICANLDQVLCVTSPESPPFRPRFIDRVVIAAEQGNVPMAIVVNKIDQNIDENMQIRLHHFEQLGIPIYYCSAKQGTGMETLEKAIFGKYTAFVGQSGVGKSSILNALEPGLKLQVGQLNEKYNRGNHTTCFAVEVSQINEAGIVDTPGIRELEVSELESDDLVHHFEEFIPYISECGFQPCTHTHEPKCAVKKAVESGLILEDRYLSYCNIFDSLKEHQKW